MEFDLPSTKTEMYAVLNNLFYYYRIKRQSYEDVILNELKLERMEFTAETEEELKKRAEKLVAPAQERELLEYKRKIDEEINGLKSKLQLVEADADEQTADVLKLYADSIKAIEEKALKAGLFRASVTVDKTASLAEEKNAKLQEIASNKNSRVAEINAKLSALKKKAENAESEFLYLHEKDVEKKTAELVFEQLETEREVFKYNNGLDEKEQRYVNTIKQINANLKLRYLDISNVEFTKDQLVEMGYYEDVIDCVCGYYDTLTASAAYKDISAEGKLAIYLDDYYQNVVYMYRSRAGL